MIILRAVSIVCALAMLPACASLEGLRAFIQPPRFTQTDQPAEVRLAGPSMSRPLGGATVRLWTEVSNPNPFGFTLGTLDGTLFLNGTRAAAAAFPLGLPLGAGQRSVVPLELSVSFSDVPALADVIRRAARREPVEYRLDGTIGVDAGKLGQPVFGPMTLMRGSMSSDSQSRILNPESSIPNPQSRILNPESSIRNPQSGILNPESPIPNP